MSGKKWERWQHIKATKKERMARQAKTSQQHRLAKHPGPSDPETTLPPSTTGTEPMETDAAEGTGTPATPGTPRDVVAAGSSRRDAIDVFLEAPPPSLPVEETEEDPPFFKETPPSSRRK